VTAGGDAGHASFASGRAGSTVISSAFAQEVPFLVLGLAL